MALQTVLEKLQIKEEKNILIQGLPSSLEKQFVKLNFAKSVTPLLKSRGIELAVVFALSKSQLNQILTDVLPALQGGCKLWISFPKTTAKIASDLCRDCQWKDMSDAGFETGELVELDSTWCALSYNKLEEERVETLSVKSKRVSISNTLKKEVKSFDHIPMGQSISSVIPMMEPKESLKRTAARP